MKTPLGTEVDLGAGHIVLGGFPALRERGTALPLLGPCLLWPRSPISATAELLFEIAYGSVSYSFQRQGYQNYVHNEVVDKTLLNIMYIGLHQMSSY